MVAEAWGWKSGEPVLAPDMTMLLSSCCAGAEWDASGARNPSAASEPAWVWAEKAASCQSWLAQMSPVLAELFRLVDNFYDALSYCSAPEPACCLHRINILLYISTFKVKKTNEAVHFCPLPCLSLRPQAVLPILIIWSVTSGTKIFHSLFSLQKLNLDFLKHTGLWKLQIQITAAEHRWAVKVVSVPSHLV